jgi:hypothetical protein
MTDDDSSPSLRLTIRVSAETRDELYKMCHAVGVKPSFCFSVALMVGMRTLVKDYSLDTTTELWAAAKVRNAPGRRPKKR